MTNIDTLNADLTYLSLGAGVQSTALLICSALGLHDVPRADVAIFADTGGEAPWTYRGLRLLAEWMDRQTRPIPIWIVRGPRSVWEIGGHTPVLPPVAIKAAHGGIGRMSRACTSELKLKPIRREVRRRLGVAPGARVPRGVVALALIGISADEAHRARESSEPWIVHDYPLLAAGLGREECREIIRAAGLPVPGKSSCIVCPFHDYAYWRVLREQEPEAFARAVAWDAAIRDAWRERSLYLHWSGRPLEEALSRSRAGRQVDAFAPVACEGMCGL